MKADTEQAVVSADSYYDRMAYDGTHEPSKAAIADTLAHLPSEVGSWALAHCVFASAGVKMDGKGVTLRAAHCVTLRARTSAPQPTHVIVLAEPAMEGRDAGYVIAEEIAHAWLGRSGFGQPEAGTEEALHEASALTAIWGF